MLFSAYQHAWTYQHAWCITNGACIEQSFGYYADRIVIKACLEQSARLVQHGCTVRWGHFIFFMQTCVGQSACMVCGAWRMHGTLRWILICWSRHTDVHVTGSMHGARRMAHGCTVGGDYYVILGIHTCVDQSACMVHSSWHVDAQSGDYYRTLLLSPCRHAKTNQTA